MLFLHAGFNTVAHVSFKLPKVLKTTALAEEPVLAPVLRVNTPRGVRFLPPPGFHNLSLTLSYDGSAFQGYQSQPNAKTVQDVLMKAWHILTSELPTFYGCSRLDAGVDARHFVLNFYTKTALTADQLVRNLNGILHSNFEEPISIYRASLVAPEFNARFDAVGKHYRYLLWYGRGQHSLLTPRCWHLKTRSAPQHLEQVFRQYVGTFDFSAFRASDCNAKTTVRKIIDVQTWHHPRFEELVLVDFWGEGFLKNMIRNMVGTAVDVATGKLPSQTIQEAYIHGKREKGGQCAPAHGLTLEQVFYKTSALEASVSAPRSFF